MASRPITPYQAPLLLQPTDSEEGNNNEQQQLLSSIRHVAISSKSYRVFGLNDVAWQTARDDLRRYTSTVAGGDAAGSYNDDSEYSGGEDCSKQQRWQRQEEEEEQSELLEICTAIYTALQIDAGGYGTAGFHLVSLIYIFFLWQHMSSVYICCCRNIACCYLCIFCKRSTQPQTLYYSNPPFASHLSLNTPTGKSTKCTTNQNIQQFSYLHCNITSTFSLSKI
jgi:hypothetical protein